ncbi:MAG: KGK domain-containing protein [Leptolyngbyaceae cyanobacterium bins.59]|nr:KGK domain-containing protein [Leptolyngbyaceae cyanobacterium bins.59]
MLDLAPTFTVGELLTKINAVFNNRGLHNLLQNTGVEVEVTQPLNQEIIRGKIRACLEFLPTAQEIIKVPTDNQLPNLGQEFNSKELLIAFSGTHLTNHYNQGFPAELLKFGSHSWQQGWIQLNLRFFPDGPVAFEELGTGEITVALEDSSLDDIRRLITETTEQP